MAEGARAQRESDVPGNAPGRAPERGSGRFPRRAPRRVAAMLTHSYYEEDARVRREAEALVEAGWSVDVYALQRREDPPRGELNGVRIVRLPVGRHQGAGIGTYVLEYLTFFVRAGLAVTGAHSRRRYRVLQVHTLPDFLAFAGLPLRLVGVPLVLDLHEAMPEFFRSRFPRAAGRLAHAALSVQERLSIAVSSAAITVNDALGDRLVALGVPRDKLTIVLNSPDLRLFDPARHPGRLFMADGTLRLVYTGAITPIYELDVVLRGIADLGASRPELAVRFDVFGRGDNLPELERLAGTLGITDRVAFHGRVPLEDVPARVAEADVGLAPTHRDPFTDFSLSTKLFEYAAMGKPVVASGLPMVERTFGTDAAWTYRPGDPASFGQVVATLVGQPVERAARTERMSTRVRELGWDRERTRYVALIERLAVEGRGADR